MQLGPAAMNSRRSHHEFNLSNSQRAVVHFGLKHASLTRLAWQSFVGSNLHRRRVLPAG